MIPIHRIQSLYAGAEWNLADDILFHAEHGYILSTPTCFLLARAVPKSAAPYDAQKVFPLSECDTWLVWAMAGDISEAMAFAPYAMKWIAFARRDGIRFYGFQKTRSKLCKMTTFAP